MTEVVFKVLAALLSGRRLIGPTSGLIIRLIRYIYKCSIFNITNLSFLISNLFKAF
jgi:hypothetical protein